MDGYLQFKTFTTSHTHHTQRLEIVVKARVPWVSKGFNLPRSGIIITGLRAKLTPAGKQFVLYDTRSDVLTPCFRTLEVQSQVHILFHSSLLRLIYTVFVCSSLTYEVLGLKTSNSSVRESFHTQPGGWLLIPRAISGTLFFKI